MKTNLNTILPKASLLSLDVKKGGQNIGYAPPFGGRLSLVKTVCVLSIIFQPVSLVTAQAQSGASDEIQSIFVSGQRRAYQGNFDDLETPQVQLTIDEKTLRNAEYPCSSAFCN